VNLVDLIERTDPLVVSGRVAQAVGIVMEREPSRQKWWGFVGIVCC
jgi:hypothetical protein